MVTAKDTTGHGQGQGPEKDKDKVTDKVTTRLSEERVVVTAGSMASMKLFWWYLRATLTCQRIVVRER